MEIERTTREKELEREREKESNGRILFDEEIAHFRAVQTSI